MGEKRKPWHRRKPKLIRKLEGWERALSDEIRNLQYLLKWSLEAASKGDVMVDSKGNVIFDFTEDDYASLELFEAEIQRLIALKDQLQNRPIPDWLTLRALRAQQQALYERVGFEDVCRSIEHDISDVFDDLLSYLSGSTHELHWRRFEEVIEQVFKSHGFQTQIGPGSADGGVDLRLIQKSPVGDLLMLVQAKRYHPTHKIGLEAVQALYGVVEAEQASKGILVTTSSFLPGARKFAEARGHRLFLADGQQIVSWIEEARRKWK